MNDDSIQETVMLAIEDVDQESEEKKKETGNPKTEKPKKKKKLSKAGILLFKIIFVIALITACYSGVQLYIGIQQYREGMNSYASLIAEVETVGNQEEQEVVTSSFKSINFDKLAEINSDIAGWITLEDTVIDYPFVHGEDNDYYLEHLFDGTVNHTGTVFIDARNNGDFSDRNTILYAHHMRNGSMFAELEGYREQDYADAHPFFRIVTPQGHYYVYPFAGLLADAYTEYNQIDFASDEEYIDFINDKIANSTFHTDIEVTAEDQIVTFSTCRYDVSEGRYAVFGKLVKAED